MLWKFKKHHITPFVLNVHWRTYSVPVTLNVSDKSHLPLVARCLESYNNVGLFGRVLGPRGSPATTPVSFHNTHPHGWLPGLAGLSQESHGRKDQVPDPHRTQPQRPSPGLQLLSLPFHFLQPHYSLFELICTLPNKSLMGWGSRVKALGAINFILHLGLSNWANINTECAAKFVCQINKK